MARSTPALPSIVLDYGHVLFVPILPFASSSAPSIIPDHQFPRPTISSHLRLFHHLFRRFDASRLTPSLLRPLPSLCALLTVVRSCISGIHFFLLRVRFQLSPFLAMGGVVQLPLPCWAAFFGETPFPASCFILLSALAIVEDLLVVGSTTSIISCAHNATAGVDHVPSSRTVMLHLFPEDLGTPSVCILSLFHLS